MNRRSNISRSFANTAAAASLVLASLGATAQTPTVPAVAATPVVTPAAATAAAVQPATTHKPGTIRIGIVMPKTQLGQGPSAGEPLRSVLEQYLASPNYEVISISALLPQQIDAEAQSKACDFLVYTDVTQKKSQSGMGFLKGAGSFTNMIPMVGAANAMTSVIATTVAMSAAEQMASLSSGLKAKTEVTLAYHINAVGNPAPVANSSFTAKPATDGQDVLTPMVEQEATAILATVTKKS